MGWFTDALTALDKPSNALQGFYSQGMSFDALKKGWKHEEEYDFEDMWRAKPQSARGWDDRKGFADTASYVASVPFNFGGDPLNALGFGMLGRGAKATQDALDAGATISKPMTPQSGRFVSSFDNYIDNWYGPGSEAKEASKKIISEGKAKGLNDSQINRAVSLSDAKFKARGFGSFVKGGFKNWYKLNTDPKAFAVFEESGVHLPKLAKYMNMNRVVRTSKDTQKAVASQIHNIDMLAQQGRFEMLPKINENLRKLQTGHFITDFEKLSKNIYADTVEKAIGKNVATRDELMHFGRHAGIVQKNISKDPNAIFTLVKSGQHWNDVTSKSKLIADIGDVFKGKVNTGTGKFTGYKTSKQLAKALEKKLGVKIKPGSIDKDGVWVQMGEAAKGDIRVGGYNLVAKVKLDGTALAVMNDEMDFLRGANALMKKRQLSMSLPFPIDLLKLKSPKRMTKVNKEKMLSGRPALPSVGSPATNWQQLPGPYKSKAKILEDMATANPHQPNLDFARARLQKKKAQALLGANMLAPEPEFKDSSYNWNN